jgi:ech hydrogenase subunit F
VHKLHGTLRGITVVFKMTPTILRNFFFKRATRRYPYVVRPPFEGYRGELYNDIANCTFCTVCAVKCPSQCIKVDKKTGDWFCDPFACVYCGICVEACTAKCLHMKSTYRPVTAERVVIALKGEPPKRKPKPGAEETASPSTEAAS